MSPAPLPVPEPPLSYPNNAKAQAILSGALEVFTAHGYAAASMDRIAKAAGVSKPTVYSYFQDKERLFVSLMQSLMHQNSQMMLALPMGQAMAQDPRALLRHMAATMLTTTAENRPFLTLMRLVIGESEQFPKLAETFVTETTKPMLESLATYLERHPQLNFPDPLVAARVFAGSIVHYLLVQEMMGGQAVMPLDRDRMIDGVIDILMLGGHYSGA